jgi:RNA polymerase sigma-70 factor (ECF subfamily)
MAVETTSPVDERALLAVARSGDEQAFARLLEPHRSALRAHCYRLLGSLHDAEDALQETSLRAWRNIDRFEPRGPFRAWLYRVATNVCLTAIERRSRVPEALDPEEAAVASYLMPYPDRLLDTELAVEERESLGLAFVSVMQLLPPRQRAVLVLREVLGWSAKEVADLLGDSVASVNSALQRAREKLERERAAGRLARDHVPSSPESEARLMRKFVAAWEAVDVDGIVALLTEDAVMTMPPEPLRLVGTDAIAEFLRTVPAEGALERIRLVPARANGQPALAAYLDDDAGTFEAYGVMVFALAGDEVASITGFAGYPELFPELGLPTTLAR